MPKGSIEERVVEIVSKQMGVATDQVTRDTNPVNDLGADSLDGVELLMDLETEFDLPAISEQDAVISH